MGKYKGVERRAVRSTKFRVRFVTMEWITISVVVVFAVTMGYAARQLEQVHANLTIAFNSLIQAESSIKDSAVKCAPPPIIRDLLETHRRTVM